MWAEQNKARFVKQEENPYHKNLKNPAKFEEILRNQWLIKYWKGQDIDGKPCLFFNT